VAKRLIEVFTAGCSVCENNIANGGGGNVHGQVI
jgi:hypothetical protein